MFKRRNRTLFVFLLFAVGIACAWFANREPSYHGRTLAEWLGAVRTNRVDAATVQQCYTAIHILGTNHMSDLVRCISFDPNRCLPQKIYEMLPGRITPGPVRDYLIGRKRNGLVRAVEATQVFRILGPESTPAIPALTEIAMNGARVPAYRSIECLGYIGEDSIPALIMIATNKPPLRIAALYSLSCLTNSPRALRSAEQLLQEVEPGARLVTPYNRTFTNTPAH